jgi:hypothetical protein
VTGGTDDLHRGGAAASGGGAPDCAAVRDALAAQPRVRSPALEEHLRTCAACARYAAEMQALDAKIRRALEVPVPAAASPLPERLAPRVPSARAAAARPGASRRWLALAASVAGAAVLATALWTGAPRDSLASDLVAHMSHEPQSWQRNPAVPESALAYVLRRSGVRIERTAGAPEVTYAHSCWFRGRFVPHLAVHTPAGPVTVMVLPEERAAGRVAFEEGGYRGVIVPAQRGALAVLAPESGGSGGGGGSVAAVDEATLDAIAARVGATVRYLDGGAN